MWVQGNGKDGLLLRAREWCGWVGRFCGELALSQKAAAPGRPELVCGARLAPSDGGTGAPVLAGGGSRRFEGSEFSSLALST